MPSTSTFVWKVWKVGKTRAGLPMHGRQVADGPRVVDRREQGENVKKKKRRSSDEIALPPLPKGVTPEDIGRVLVQQIKPVQPVVNRKKKGK